MPLDIASMICNAPSTAEDKPADSWEFDMSGTTAALRDLLIAVAYSNTWLPLTDTFHRACAASGFRSEPGKLFDQAGDRVPNPFEEFD
jgi:hypothetical protein